VIYTFYSYKGGVGRSMAVANIGAWLSELGLRVVLVDFDLEAPGLESYFASLGTDVERVSDSIGLIDVLESYKRMLPNLELPAFLAKSGETSTSIIDEAPPIVEGSQVRSRAVPGEHLRRDVHGIVEVLDAALPPLRHALHPLRATERGDGGALWLLPAGLRSGDRFKRYAESVQRFGWGDFYARYHGEAYFEWFRGQLTDPAHFDVVLVDSRTGVTEMGGVCTRQLADVVVCLAAPNLQNVEGVARMVESMLRDDVLQRRGRDLQVVMVPARVDNFNTHFKNMFEREFATHLARYTPTAFTAIGSDFWRLRIPYISDYAYRERLAFDDPEADRDLKEAFKNLAAHLSILAPGTSAMRSRLATENLRIFGRALPEVFFAYHGDSHPSLLSLRSRLAEAGVAIWPDPGDLTTVTPHREAHFHVLLEQSKTMVLQLDRAALASGFAARLWRAARRRGVRVLPLQVDDALDRTDQPGFVRDATTFHPGTDFDALLRTLQHPSPVAPVPFMVRELPAIHVPRRDELMRAERAVLGGTRGTAPVVVLCGAPGIGKSTLAVELCQLDTIQDAFPDGIAWLDFDNEDHDEVRLERLEAAFGIDVRTRDRLDLATRLQRIFEGKRSLLVLDEVVALDRVRPFLFNAPQCVRLITTRDTTLAYELEGLIIPLGGLELGQARDLLLKSIAVDEREAGELTDPVVQRVERSPLLLAMINRDLRQRMDSGDSLQTALSAVEDRLQRLGIAALGTSVPGSKGTINETVTTALVKLTSAEQRYLYALALAPEHSTLEEIARPLQTPTTEAEEMVRHLAAQSLVEWDRADNTVSITPLLRFHFIARGTGGLLTEAPNDASGSVDPVPPTRDGSRPTPQPGSDLDHDGVGVEHVDRTGTWRRDPPMASVRARRLRFPLIVLLVAMSIVVSGFLLWALLRASPTTAVVVEPSHSDEAAKLVAKAVLAAYEAGAGTPKIVADIQTLERESAAFAGDIAAVEMPTSETFEESAERVAGLRAKLDELQSRARTAGERVKSESQVLAGNIGELETHLGNRRAGLSADLRKAAERVLEQNRDSLERFAELDERLAATTNALSRDEGALMSARRTLDALATGGSADRKSRTFDKGRAQWYIGYSALLRGDDENAKQIFEACVRNWPKYAAPQNSLGVIALREHDLEAATQHFRKALSLDSGYAPAENNLALVEMRRGDYKKAEAHVLRALELSPNFSGARDNLVDVREHLAGVKR